MNFKVLAHTHWDREWYFSHYRARVYSYIIFDEIIEHLENNPDYKYFILDGQTSIIEEYLTFHPNMRERLEKLIKEKRIFTGPWYSQTDTLVISGENIVRNLLYGTKQAKEYGHCMNIGYLPDSFGMSEQMPQIYQGFDLKYAMFRRGIADHMSKDREFYWISPDRSKVFSHNVYHYGNMAYPPEDDSLIEEYMDEMIEKIGPSSKTGNIVLFNGEDQKPIRKNLINIINKMNEIGKEKGITTEIVSPEDLMDELYRSDYDFDEYQGELTFGQYSRTHKSIFSTRYDLKQKNNYLENYLVNTFEPLLSLSHILGFNYEKESVDYIWKRMLDNSAHDSIGMCNSDITNMFINHRYEEVLEFSRNLVDLKLREISMNIKNDNIFQFQVFNMLPYTASKIMNIKIYVPSKNFCLIRDDGAEIEYQLNNIVDVTEKIRKLSIREAGVAGNIHPEWIEKCNKIYEVEITANICELNPYGYETINVIESSKDNINKNIMTNEKFIENELIKISIEDDKICLLDKILNKKYEDFIYLEDDGDEGDSYDYSEPTDDLKIREIEVKSIKTKEDIFNKELIVNSSMLLPYDLVGRKNKVFSKAMNIELSLILEKDTSIIKTKISVENPSIEHRVRLVINPEISSEISLADEQFGTIIRPTVLNYPNWKEDGFNEKPRTIEPMMTYCSIFNDNSTLQVLTDDVREYQVIGEKLDRIAMTIFRSTPYLGKESLNDRPGRESGNKSETFDTRYINKVIEAEYYINLKQRKLSASEMSKLSKEIFTPFIYYQAAEFKNNTEYLVLNQPKEKYLPRKLSLLSIQDDLVLSTIKRAEEGSDIVLRLFNPDNKKEKVFSSVKFDGNYLSENIKQVKLNEVTELLNDHKFNPCQQKTYKISLKNLK